jgi:4-hydroxybenzoate polyprenyltransferase
MLKPKQQENQYSISIDNNASFAKRFYIYQKERFPFLGHGLLVLAFSFSAIAYSRICRGMQGFVSTKVFLLGIFTTITLFFLLRIFDEFKDAEDDANYRKELPVPRGLVSLSELKIVGIVVAILQVIVNAIFFPKMLLLYLIVIAYLLLMGKEFFIATWLKKNQFFYVVSHMFIIPLVDIYASGLDWFLSNAVAPKGLIFFFAVSYMNGVVLEIGRKIKAPEFEAVGVLSYSFMLGFKKATYLWLAILLLTLILSIGAAHYAGYGLTGFYFLASAFVICAIPAFIFLIDQTKKTSKAIEISSAIWTIAMYLILGGIPMIQKLLSN